MDETLIYLGLAAAAAAAMALPRVVRRVELSRAKHPSLSGHARLAHRVAALIPFYAYSEEAFFSPDDAPADIAGRRRAACERLSDVFRTRFPRTLRLTEEQFTSLAARMRDVCGQTTRGAMTRGPTPASTRLLPQRSLARRQGKQWEDLFALQLATRGIEHVREHRFLPQRRFRFDFAIVPLERKIAV